MKRKPHELPGSLKSVDVKALLRKRGIYRMLDENRFLKEAALPLAKRLVKSRIPARKVEDAQVHPTFSNEEAIAYWEKQIHIVEVLEARFEAKVENFITKVVDGYLGHLESEIATTKQYKNKDKDYFADNEDALMAQAQLDFTPLLINQATLAGQEALRLIKSDDVYIPMALREEVAKNVAKFTQSMLETDRDTLINLITHGIENGDSVAQIRGSIQADFDNITKSQAQRITRTEVLRASNQAALDAWDQSGVVEAKQWLTAGATDECAQYEGQIETLHGSFYSGSSEFLDGDPPLHPNCKCVLLPVLINEKSYSAPVNQELYARIAELESQIDKRTKAFKLLKEKQIDDELYMKALEKHLNIGDHND